jgi:hypothetical protein
MQDEIQLNWNQIEPGEQLVATDVEPANLRRLASAMIEQAARDLINGDRDAFLWLTDPLEPAFWADVADIQWNPYRWLLPNLKRAKRALRMGAR